MFFGFLNTTYNFFSKKPDFDFDFLRDSYQLIAEKTDSLSCAISILSILIGISHHPHGCRLLQCTLA